MLVKIKEYIRNWDERAFETQASLTAVPAVGPENGGDGEAEKAAWIERRLRDLGVVYTRHDCADARVKRGYRPNIVAEIPGVTERSFWLFAHMDVVAPGDPSAWQSDPWRARREGDYVYGRGVEDNQQAIVSMLALAEALTGAGAKPFFTLKLAFLADEENGSSRGLEFLLNSRPDLFYPEDLYLVPDGGSPDGLVVEVAEKGQLWLKFTVFGEQCHASTPGEGVNAFLAASELVLKLDGLNDLFKETNPLFKPPTSTFTPTRHENNVDNVNILPGKDVFYVDCRLLPEVSPAEALDAAETAAAEVDRRRAVRTTLEVMQNNPATETSINAPVVRRLFKAIYEERGKMAIPVGIGGATVASFLRRRGYAAAVWATIENTCHQPNERSSLSATLDDALIFADIAMGGDI